MNHWIVGLITAMADQHAVRCWPMFEWRVGINVLLVILLSNLAEVRVVCRRAMMVLYLKEGEVRVVCRRATMVLCP